MDRKQLPSFNSYVNAHVLTEAFSEGDLTKALGKIRNVLERKLGLVFYQHAGIDQYANAEGEGYGIRYYLGNTMQAVRFNFVKDGNSHEIVSVDIWDNGNSKDPTARINTQGISIAKIIPGVVEVIKTPSTWIGQELSMVSGESVELPVYEESVEIDGQTFSSKKEAAAHLLQQGYKPTEVSTMTGMHASQVYSLRKTLNAGGAIVTSGLPETSADPDIRAGNKALAEKKYADPKQVFEDLRDLLDLVISGQQSSLLITGMAGIGKTHDVTTRLKKYLGDNVDSGNEGASWHVVKGFSTPIGMYSTIFENRDKLIVFDDCDSILKEPNARNILKAALDSYDERIVSWISKRTFNPEGMTEDEIQAKYDDSDGQDLPSRFPFTGQIIFISNLDKDKIEEAILSRSFAIDITLKASDVFLRIESILEHLAPDISMEIKQEALDHLKEVGSKSGKPANLRTMIGAAKIRKGGSENWKRLVERYA